VTASPIQGDAAALWMVSSAQGEPSCAAGSPVKCGESVRLTHLLTGKNLHSHEYRSPLTHQQEVSAFGQDGQGDGGDNWQVVCAGTYWNSDQPFHLRHLDTGRYLAASDQAKFTQQNCPNCPIVGQLEIAGVKAQKDSGKWVVQRGVFIKAEDA
jgi:dolichyl-phosphate-mannose--protein O-mannosyl transferase